MKKEIKGFCAITEVNNSDFHLCKTAISSFISCNEWFDGTLVLINTGSELTNHNKNILNLIYSKIDIIYPDDSKILTKLRKKKNTNKRSNFLFTHAFKIKSEGNIFFSKTNLFMGEISSILDKDHFSISISSNSFPDLNQTLDRNLNHNLIFVPKKYISEERYDNLQKIICESKDLHDALGESNVIKRFIKSGEIKTKVPSNTTIVNSSMFDNTKYATFIRYHEAISSLNMDTSLMSNSFNYKRIHGYWKQFNHNLNLGINNSPRKRKPSSIKATPRLKYRAKMTPTLGKFALSPTIPSYVEKEDLSKISKENINISVCTVCNDEFVQGAQVLIYSFLKNNPWFNGDFIVFYNNEYSRLSLENKNKMSKLYSKIEFRNVDISDYSKVIKRFKRLWKGKPQERFIPSLFTYEAFELTREYDKVLFLDSDMLVTGNVSNLLNIEEDVTVTPDTGKYDVHKKYNTFNGGFLLLNGDQSKYKAGLLKFGEVTNNHALADQSMMNDYFNGNVSFLNSRYNCLKRCFNDRNFYRYDKQIKIIHYVGAKPWRSNKSKMELNYTKIESMWHEVYNNIDYSKTLNIVTTSYSDLNIKNIKGKIITTNWGIDLGIFNIDYYVCSTLDDNLIKSINRSNSNVKKWLITNNLKSKLQSVDYYIDLFDYIRKLGNLGELHMKSKNSRGNLDLPTSGVQLIYISSYMDISELNIYGINLYTIKDKSGNYKKIGTTMSENPYTMDNKPHSIKTDIEFITDSFKRLLNNGVIVKSDSKILNDILSFVKKGMSTSKIINKIHE